VGIHLDTFLNIHLNINNENHVCKIGRVCVVVLVGGGDEMKLRWWYLVDELHIPLQNRTKKPFAITISDFGRSWGGEKRGAQ
jgi:hypothetical protein